MVIRREKLMKLGDKHIPLPHSLVMNLGFHGEMAETNSLLSISGLLRKQ
jgi:hypothetical protein